MKNFLKNKNTACRPRFSEGSAGFTIIEVVVALGVVVTGVIAGLTLTTYNLNVAVASDFKLIAANLAREGVEAVREVRDSNWLENNPWDMGLTDLAGYRLTANFDSSANLWSFNVQTTDIANCDNCKIYLDKASGVYSHNALNSPTNFKREIILQQICWQDAVGDEVVLNPGLSCEDQEQELAGLEVHSLVTWLETGKPQQLEAVDKLYNWR